MRVIPEEAFLNAATGLAEMVTDEDLESGNLYPPLNDIKKCSLKIAVNLMEYAYQNCKFKIVQSLNAYNLKPILFPNKLFPIGHTI